MRPAIDCNTPLDESPCSRGKPVEEEPMTNNTVKSSRTKILIRTLHWIIIANFAVQMCYAAYMVFVVFAPEGVSGPLYEVAKSLPFEEMVTRRLYAIEFWIATVGLAIYLAITEIRPRLSEAAR